MRNIQITYRAGRENANADALSRCPVEQENPITSVPDLQVSQIQSTDKDLVELLQSPPVTAVPDPSAHYSHEQGKDPEILELRQFSSQGELPDDP